MFLAFLAAGLWLAGCAGWWLRGHVGEPTRTVYRDVPAPPSCVRRIDR